ncbi:MAG TPA: universal stress protein [Pseudonocardia sp.]|nr:universal stress protein [Pseudonocardia sp.]
MSQRTALASLPTPRPPRYDTRHHDALVVMARGLDVPGWVVESCLRSGREVRIEPAAGAPEERIRTLTALAGRSVLITGPPDEDRSGTPRVVAAVRDLPSDARVLTEAAAAAVQLGAVVVPVHGVPLSFGERSVGLAEALARGHRVLDAAVERLTAERGAAGLTILPRLLRVRPHELVGEELDADLLVLGGPRPRIPARIGLVGGSAVQHAPCPVLLAARPA